MFSVFVCLFVCASALITCEITSYVTMQLQQLLEDCRPDVASNPGLPRPDFISQLRDNLGEEGLGSRLGQTGYYTSAAAVSLA